jgi:hypothetical protein
MAIKKYNEFVNESFVPSNEEKEAYIFLDQTFIPGKDYIPEDMIGDDKDSDLYYNEIFLAMVDKVRERFKLEGPEEDVANDWVERYLQDKL